MDLSAARLVSVRSMPSTWPTVISAEESFLKKVEEEDYDSLQEFFQCTSFSIEHRGLSFPLKTGKNTQTQYLGLETLSRRVLTP